MWDAMWNNFYSTMRGMSYWLKGAIIFVLIVGALISLMYALKGGKKEKMVHNWFLFFLSILLGVLGIAFAVMTGLMR